jgi:hypothetical protein
LVQIEERGGRFILWGDDEMQVIRHDAIHIHPAGRLLLLLEQAIDGNAGIVSLDEGSAAGSAANGVEAGLSGLGVSVHVEAGVSGMRHGVIMAGVDGAQPKGVHRVRSRVERHA